MEKYLKRLCKAILEGRFNDENYRTRRSWYGKDIMTEPLFCSYGKIGFTIIVYENYDQFCTISCDFDLGKLTIDDTPWKEYINLLYLEDFDITDYGGGELECYTDAGEDMIITLDKVRKKNLQEYIDNFDINEEVLLWWQDGRPGKGVPFANVKEHYEDYEAYLEKLQKACDKMPY
jgi:hypothetical protein